MPPTPAQEVSPYGDGTQPPRKKQRDRNGRKNAAIACDACRQRRVRCQASEQPGQQQCVGCAASGLACVISGSDGRKERMQDLRNKVLQLESLFSTLSGTPTESSHPLGQIGDVSVNGPAFPRASMVSPNAQEPTASVQSLEIDLVGDTRERKRRRLSDSVTLEEDVAALSPVPPPFPSPDSSGTLNMRTERSPSSSGRPILPLQPGVAGVPVVMDKLTLEAGEIRAYGPTSNQTLATEGHVSHEPTEQPDSRMPAPSHYQYEPFEKMSLLVAAARNVESVPLGTDIRTVEHLLVNYFIWHHAVFPITSCRLFLDHFQHGGRYCSPLLLNAMLALASHLSDWKLADPEDASTTGSTFFAQAKSLLDAELENPSVTTVQALCLMAKYEAYHGRALKGGLYIVMCGRLVLDLGLHLDSTHLVHKGVLPDEAAWMRSRTFWGVWSVDKEFSALVGRPSAIRGILINCPKPSYWIAEDLDWWKSYHSGRLVGITDDPSDGIYQISDYAIAMAGVHLKAMDLMYWREDKLSLEENMAALEASMAATAEAMSRLPQLPESGPINPHAVTLHMVYSCHIIILNRPFLFANGFRTGGSDSPARIRCFDSAREIVRLMALIRDATPHGLRTTLNCHQHNLVTAAAILILELTPRIATRERVSTAHEDLGRIFSMLHDMSVFRPAAKQALENLRELHQTAETQSTLASMAAGYDLNSKISSTRSQQADSVPSDTISMFDFDGVKESGAPWETELFDFTDFDAFLAQQQSYLYPTISCSNLFDTNGFLQTQLLQSRPPSREGRPM